MHKRIPTHACAAQARAPPPPPPPPHPPPGAPPPRGVWRGGGTRHPTPPDIGPPLRRAPRDVVAEQGATPGDLAVLAAALPSLRRLGCAAFELPGPTDAVFPHVTELDLLGTRLPAGAAPPDLARAMPRLARVVATGRRDVRESLAPALDGHPGVRDLWIEFTDTQEPGDTEAWMLAAGRLAALTSLEVGATLTSLKLGSCVLPATPDEAGLALAVLPLLPRLEGLHLLFAATLLQDDHGLRVVEPPEGPLRTLLRPLEAPAGHRLQELVLQADGALRSAASRARMAACLDRVAAANPGIRVTIKCERW